MAVGWRLKSLQNIIYTARLCKVEIAVGVLAVEGNKFSVSSNPYFKLQYFSGHGASIFTNQENNELP